MKKVKLLAVLFSNIVLFCFLTTSCTVSYRGTSYGRVIDKCPTTNPTSFFFMQGTGRPFLPKYAVRRKPL